MKRRSNKGEKRPVAELREPLKKLAEEELTTEDLQKLISGKRFRLDCGHRCTVGHNLANVMIIHSDGGGKITTECHQCGY